MYIPVEIKNLMGLIHVLMPRTVRSSTISGITMKPAPINRMRPPQNSSGLRSLRVAINPDEVVLMKLNVGN